MTIDALETIVTAQARLIEAIDSRDPDLLEAATAALADAVARAKEVGAWNASAEAKPRLDRALRQADAAKTRINCLSAWTRQRIDRLAELRGSRTSLVYTKD